MGEALGDHVSGFDSQLFRCGEAHDTVLREGDVLDSNWLPPSLDELSYSTTDHTEVDEACSTCPSTAACSDELCLGSVPFKGSDLDTPDFHITRWQIAVWRARRLAEEFFSLPLQQQASQACSHR